MTENENSFARLWGTVKKYLTFQIEYAKLTAAEKLTMIFGAVALGFIFIMLATVIGLFASLAIAYLLADAVGMEWAFAIMAAFYLLVAVFLYVFRKQIILDPIARFLSKVILS